MESKRIRDFLSKYKECYVVPNTKKWRAKNFESIKNFAISSKSDYIMVGMPTKSKIAEKGNSLLLSHSTLSLFAESIKSNINRLLKDDDAIFEYHITPNKPRGKKKETSWVKQTKTKLKKQATKYEDIVYKALVGIFPINEIERQKHININGKQYFLDIYLHKYKVAIEIDGGYHLTDSQINRDKERDYLVSTKGIRTLRITNEDTQDVKKILALINYIVNTS